MGVAALLLAAGGATAAPMQVGEETDYTDCLARSAVETEILHDAIDGNLWGLRDTFTLTGTEGCTSADIYGISVIVKTPFQIDSTPDIDDIDSEMDFNILRDELESLWEDFGHWTAGAELDPMGMDIAPTIGPEGTFTSVEFCVTQGATTVAACMAGTPLAMMDIGGGYMIHTFGLGEGAIFLDEEDGDFQMVTKVHSNVFSPPEMGDVDISELMIGWRMVQLVPEPSLLALLAPALALARIRRRRTAL